MALPNFSQTAMQWQVYNTPKNLVYQAGLDFTTYGSFTFGPKGSVQQTPNAGVQEAAGVGIDNTGNMNPVTVSIGNLFTETVPAFTKTLVALGSSSPPVTITGAGGQATATFYTGIYPGSIAQSNILGATKQAIAVYLPPGLMMMFGGLTGTIPDGWLYCNGAAISRVSYAPLFNAIGTKFGAGDGASTFNLPDMRAMFPRGFDDGAGRDGTANRALGSTQAAGVGQHQHQTPFGSANNSLFGFVDGQGYPDLGYDGVTANIEYVQPVTAQGAAAVNRGRTGGVILQQLGTAGGDNRPMNVALLYIVKT